MGENGTAGLALSFPLSLACKTAVSEWRLEVWKVASSLFHCLSWPPWHLTAWPSRIMFEWVVWEVWKWGRWPISLYISLYYLTVTGWTWYGITLVLCSYTGKFSMCYISDADKVKTKQPSYPDSITALITSGCLPTRNFQSSRLRQPPGSQECQQDVGAHFPLEITTGSEPYRLGPPLGGRKQPVIPNIAQKTFPLF